jgi:protein-S-isoprenylcysteine O-methyltransferase Ste14
VVAQSVCFVAILATGIVGPDWPEAARTAVAAIGWALGAAGTALLVAGVVSLGPSLTPYPKPSEGSTLQEGGAYRLVRHPIYGGFVLLGIGWSLVLSPLALLPTAFLGATFELKSRFEEQLLEERYPGYATYRTRVRRRLVPWVH